MKDRTHKNFCSKHQVVHGENINWWSCTFPNDKERSKIKREWRNNPESQEE